jgi:hypothetical protein
VAGTGHLSWIVAVRRLQGVPISRPKHTILYLAANPSDTSPLALDREARSIQVELERSSWRDRFEFVTRWAAEPLDLLRELRRLQPTVVQFSGHGGDRAAAGERGRAVRRDVAGGGGAGRDECPGLFFQGPDGTARVVSATALRDTLGAAGSSVKLVVLNACYSDRAAEALLAHVDCVVGMAGSIGDVAARSFGIGFYGGLGERESVEAAFRGGCAAIGLEGLADGDLPQLRVRRGVDASALVLGALASAGPRSAAEDRQAQVSIGGAAIGNVIVTGHRSVVDAQVKVATPTPPPGDPATVDMATELAEIRAILAGLASEHANKIDRALDDACDEVCKTGGANREQAGRALERAVGYARSASGFATAATRLAPHLRSAATWLGGRWNDLLDLV